MRSLILSILIFVTAEHTGAKLNHRETVRTKGILRSIILLLQFSESCVLSIQLGGGEIRNNESALRYILKCRQFFFLFAALLG